MSAIASPSPASLYVPTPLGSPVSKEHERGDSEENVNRQRHWFIRRPRVCLGDAKDPTGFPIRTLVDVAYLTAPPYPRGRDICAPRKILAIDIQNNFLTAHGPSEIGHERCSHKTCPIKTRGEVVDDQCLEDVRTSRRSRMLESPAMPAKPSRSGVGMSARVRIWHPHAPWLYAYKRPRTGPLAPRGSSPAASWLTHW